MRTFIVHGQVSNIIRRVIVSDTLTIDQVGLVPGEEVFEVPHEDYKLMTTQALQQHVAKTIGEPLYDGRCVELDPDGNVLAVFSADPLIDKPILHPDNVLEIHPTAMVGDIKQADGSFVSLDSINTTPISTIPALRVYPPVAGDLAGKPIPDTNLTSESV